MKIIPESGRYLKARMKTKEITNVAARFFFSTSFQQRISGVMGVIKDILKYASQFLQSVSLKIQPKAKLLIQVLYLGCNPGNQVKQVEKADRKIKELISRFQKLVSHCHIPSAILMQLTG